MAWKFNVSDLDRSLRATVKKSVAEAREGDEEEEEEEKKEEEEEEERKEAKAEGKSPRKGSNVKTKGGSRLVKTIKNDGEKDAPAPLRGSAKGKGKLEVNDEASPSAKAPSPGLQMRKSGKSSEASGKGYVADAAASAFLVFRKYDLDGSGGISPEELRLLLEECALQLSKEESELAVNLLSRGGTQEISFADFSAWWNSDRRLAQLQWTQNDVATLRALREDFIKFDKDGGGTISRSEFKDLHAALLQRGYKIPAQIDECFGAAVAGKPASKGLNFYDFVTYLRGLGFSKAAPPPPKENLLARGDSAVRVWLQHDTDGSCGLGAAELRNLFKTMGYEMSLEECQLAIKLLASHGADEITLPEFKAWFDREDRFRVITWDSRELARLRRFQQLFDRFDVDGSGELAGDEIEKLHAELVRSKFAVPELEEFIENVDSDGNGKINFSELTNYLRSRRIFYDSDQ